MTGYALITGAGPVQFSDNQPLQIPQTDVTEAVLGLFSYSTELQLPAPSGIVVEAASGVVSGKLLRDVKLSYSSPTPGVQLVTTATLNGGIKVITSTYKDPLNPRLASITSIAGSGGPGEMESELWIWNGNLTLFAHSDGNNVTTVFAPYDALGNPEIVTEGLVAGYNVTSSGVVTLTEPTSQPIRTTKIAWHPVLSRPLSITTEFVSTPGCFSTGSTPCNMHQIIFDYDDRGNCAFSTDYNTKPSNYLYQIIESGYTWNNLAPNLSSTPEVHTVQICRDAVKRIATIIDPGELLNNLRLFGVDRLPDGRDAAVNRTETLTANFSFDANGRIKAIVDPNGNSNTTLYDLAGMVVVSGISSADGTEGAPQTYRRDLAENVTQRTTHDGTLFTEFDSGLRPWRVSGSGQGSVAWSRVTDFDLFNRPVTVRRFAGVGSDDGFGCTTSGPEQTCAEQIYDPYERLVTTHTLDPTNAPCPLPGCASYYRYDGTEISNKAPATFRIISFLQGTRSATLRSRIKTIKRTQLPTI